MAVGDPSAVAAPERGAPSGRRERPAFQVRGLIERYGVVIALGVLILAFSAVIPDKFATSQNFQVMINSQAVLLLLAIAATVPLRTGDFDLSISSLMTLVAAVVAKMLGAGDSLLLAILAALAIGVVVGLINGILIVKVGIDSFVCTLGGLTALTGATYAVTDTQVLFGFDGGVLSFSRTELLGLPLVTWYAWILVAIAWYVYECTPVGRYLLFVGGNRDVGRLAGIDVDRVRIGAFVASSVISAFAGIALVGQLGALDPSIGGGYLLQPFAAAFLGATTIYVGRFNAIGTMVSLYLLVVGITGLQLMGAEPWVSNLFNGLALIAAVTLARLAGRRARA